MKVVVSVIFIVIIGCFGFKFILLVRLMIKVRSSLGSVDGEIGILINGLMVGLGLVCLGL